MSENNTLEMIAEIIQGVIAILLVGALLTIALVEVFQGRGFTEPTTLSALAGAAVGFYFGQRNQRRQQETISALSDKIINGTSTKP